MNSFDLIGDTMGDTLAIQAIKNHSIGSSFLCDSLF